jgi:membrane protein
MLTRANSIAFNLMLALFPALLFLLTLLPYLPFVGDKSTMMLQSFQGVLPTSAFDYLSSIVQSIIGQKNQELLSIGFILALFFSSNGMLSLMNAFSKNDKKHFKHRTIIKERWIAVVLTLAIGFLFIFSLILVVVGNIVFQIMDLDQILPRFTQLLILTARWLVTFAAVYAGVTIVYRYAPRFRQRTSFMNPGSIMATLLSLLSSLGFSYIVNEFGRYNEIYGSFGALIVIMVWLQINAFIILAGYELNASITMNKPL